MENCPSIQNTLETKVVASFIKTYFYSKRSYIKICKYAEIFHNNKGRKLAIVGFIPTSLFSK